MKNIEKSLEKFDKTMKFLEEFEKTMELIKKHPVKQLKIVPTYSPYEIQKLY